MTYLCKPVGHLVQQLCRWEKSDSSICLETVKFKRFHFFLILIVWHCLRLDSVILTGWYCWLFIACMLCLKRSIWGDVPKKKMFDIILRLGGAVYLANSCDVSKMQNKQRARNIGQGYIKWCTIWLQLCGSLLKMWYVLSKNRPILTGQSQYTTQCVTAKVMCSLSSACWDFSTLLNICTS